MYEYEVLLIEKSYGRVTVKADGMEQAKEIALQSAEVEWEDPEDAEALVAIRI